MTWQDDLVWSNTDNSQRKMASFRGATFFVRDVDTSVGRRNVSHQYPLRDDPYIEDLGADIDEFVVNGYVVQNQDNDSNYIPQRDTLITALKMKGPGTLIHPFYGEKLVSLVGKARISETFHPGGIARFSMTFAKVSDVYSYEAPPYPKKIVDYQKSVDNAVEDSYNDSVDAFGSKFYSINMPDFSSSAIMTAIDSLNKMLKSATLFVQGAGPAQISRALDYLSEEYLGIDLDALNDTCGLANGLIGMFNGLLSLGGMYGDIVLSQLFGSCSSAVRGVNSGPWSGSKTEASWPGHSTNSTSEPDKIDEAFGKNIVRASLEMNRYGEESGIENPSVYGGSIDATSLTTPAKARQSANLIAIVNLARCSAILNAAKMAIRLAYTSYNSAVEIMNEVVSAIDTQIIKLGDDSADDGYDQYNITISDPYSFQALDSLRPIFVESMKGVGAELAKIVDYQVPPAVTSTLTVAYDRYNDLDRSTEIFLRNTPLAGHPGFLPGGKTIEILNQ